MRLITPPKNQGQIVDVSFGWHECALYRCTYDQSDRSVQWEVLDDEISDGIVEDWCAVNGAPDVPEWAWISCEDPDPVDAAERDLVVLERFRDSRKA